MHLLDSTQTVHYVFPSPLISKHRGIDPISIKKLEQGEGLWEFRKIILGWLFDGIERKITLPTEKLTLISKEIKAVYWKKAIPLQRYQQLVVKLRHASFGIPTGKGLFTPLHAALKGGKQYIKLTSLLIATLRDWRVLINITLQDPVKARQLFPRKPEFVGEYDAC